MDKKIWIVVGGVILSIVLFLIVPPSLSNYRNLFIALILIGSAVPLIASYILRERRFREKDQKFLEFVRDIGEGVKSGTPITQTIINLRNRDYGALKPHTEKIANQILMGIPLTGVLENFAIETKSPLIIRSVNLISEANKSGGDISTILSAVVSSIDQTELIRKERRSSIFNLIVQGYIIFTVFILIILMLEFFLIPLVGNMESPKDFNELESVSSPNDDLTLPLFMMLITQSIFSGLVVGKLSEGKISAGIKHSFILVSLAILLSTLARVLFG